MSAPSAFTLHNMLQIVSSEWKCRYWLTVADSGVIYRWDDIILSFYNWESTWKMTFNSNVFITVSGGLQISLTTAIFPMKQLFNRSGSAERSAHCWYLNAELQFIHAVIFYKCWKMREKTLISFIQPWWYGCLQFITFITHFDNTFG